MSTWTGAIDALWSTNGNWDIPPVAGDDLVFPVGASNLTSVNDLASLTSFGALTISGSGYTISGSEVTLTGAVESSQDAGVNTVELPITFDGAAAVTVDEAGTSLVLEGAISGDEGLTKSGAGVLELATAGAFSGSMIINGGELNVDAALGTSPVTINAGATLGGSGTVGTITSNSGTVRPGGVSPAVLTESGVLNLGTGSTFNVALNGTTAGSGYSQLSVLGSVNLLGATLSASAGFTAAVDDAFTIIDNLGDQPVSGTFDGLSEGGQVVVSSQPFRISYIGGTGNDVVLTRLTDTTTALNTSSTSVVAGQTITLTATVAPAGGASGSPSGNVRFFNGLTLLGTAVISGGVATLQNVTLPVGTASLTAQYVGDDDFGTSTSTPVAVMVAQASTTTTVATSPNPSTSGQTVTLSATVAAVSPGAGTPTGTVQFFSGSTSLGTATLSNGVATLTTTALATGANSITAQYQGDTSFTASTSPAVTQTVNAGVATTTTVAVSPSPSVTGQSVTLTANVTSQTSGAGIPTGMVQFFSGSTSLGTATLDSGGVTMLTTTALTAGTNSLTARYQGDSTFAISTSEVVTATVNRASTTTTITSSEPNPSALGQPVTLSASVAIVSPGAGTLTGSVQFFSGTTALGTVSLNNGVAILTTSAMPTGANSVTATYLGDTNFGASTSSAIVQNVSQGSATVSVTVSKFDPVTTEAVVFTATVAPVSPATTTPTGTVDFFANGVLLGSGTLSNGQATLITTQVPVGDQSITAVYLGDSSFVGESTSPPLAMVVGDQNELFLNQIYLDVLHRPIGQPALNHRLTELVTGTPRKQVVRSIFNTPDFKSVNLLQSLLGSQAAQSRRNKPALVNNLYLAILNRPAGTKAIRRTVGQLNSGTSVKQVIIDLFASNEFYAMFAR